MLRVRGFSGSERITSRQEYFMRSNSMPAADLDNALLMRSAQGDLDAFDILVTNYKEQIIRFATRCLGDQDEAQDVAQKVFVQAFQHCAQFRFESTFSAWLFTIARNLCRNELRRRWRLWHGLKGPLETEQGEPIEPARENLRDDTTPREVMRRELEEKVHQALAALPDRQRSVFHLLLEEELSYEQISVVQGISLSSTKMIIHRGRQVLKRKLRPYVLSGI